MTDFASTLRAAIVADPEQSRRGRRVVSIIDSPDSPWRTRHLARWEAAVRSKYGDDVDQPGFTWDKFWTVLSRVALALSLILMLLPFLGEEPDETVERLRKLCAEQYVPGVHDPIFSFPLSDIDCLLRHITTEK